jgi:hypothetical protein
VFCPQHVAPDGLQELSGQQPEPLAQQLGPHWVPVHVATPTVQPLKLVAQVPLAQQMGVAAGQMLSSPQQVSPGVMQWLPQHASPMPQHVEPHCGCPMMQGTPGGQSSCVTPQKPPPQHTGVLEPQQPLGPQPGPAVPGPTHWPQRLSLGSQQMPLTTVVPVGQHWSFAAHCWPAGQTPPPGQQTSLPSMHRPWQHCWPLSQEPPPQHSALPPMHWSLQHCSPTSHAPEPQHTPFVTQLPLQHWSPVSQMPPMPQQTCVSSMQVPLQHFSPEVHAPSPQHTVPQWPLQHISPLSQQPPPHGLVHVVPPPSPPEHAFTAACASDSVHSPQPPVHGIEPEDS